MKKLLTPVSAFQLYHVIRYGALILTGIVFTKTSLTQADIGQWEMFLLLAGAVTFFWLTGLLKAMLVMKLPGNGEADRGAALFTTFVVISLLSLMSAGFLAVAGRGFSRFLLNGSPVPFMPLLMVFLVIGVPSNLIEYLYLFKGENRKIVRYGIISFLFQLGLVLVPAVAGMGLRAALAGLVFSMAGRYFWLLFLLLKGRKPVFSVPLARRLLVLGWPLVAATLLSGSAQYVDSFIITSRFDREAFALFQYGARELPFAVLLANALSTSMLPAFAQPGRLASNLRDLKNNTRTLMHVLFPGSALLLLLTHPLYPLFFNASFAGSATIFNIYLLLVMSRLVFPQTILTGLNHTRPILGASAIELAVNVAVSLLLVGRMGLPGVAAGTVVAYGVEKIVLAGLVRRKLGIRPHEYIPLKLLGLYSAALLALFFLVELIAH